MDRREGGFRCASSADELRLGREMEKKAPEERPATRKPLAELNFSLSRLVYVRVHSVSMHTRNHWHS